MSGSQYRVRSHPISIVLRMAFLTIAIASLLDHESVAATTIYPQSVTATLSGTVVDEQDAVVAAVNVTTINVDTGLQWRVTTNKDGYFIIPALPPGRYTVSLEHQGFAAVEIQDVVLNVNDQRALKIRLKV